MLTKKITYEDFNGTLREETFLFNVNKSEVTEMELSTQGGLVEKINDIVAAKDGEQIIKFFKEFILKAYGEKSPDGRRFIKTEEAAMEFSQTIAYDILFMELVTDPNAAAAFVSGVLPAPEPEDNKPNK